MKRILSFVLVLVMSLGLLAGCTEPAPTTAPKGSGLEDAKNYLAAMYKDTDGTVARRDFSVVAVVMIDGVSYPVTWTTDAPDFVTIGAAENNKVLIDIVEEPEEQVTFKLTGTLTDAEVEYMPWGAKLMTLECGIRFLTDYLDGDNYFHIRYADQNLDRTRTQFKLVSDMEQQWDEMHKIVREIAQ